MFKKILFNLSIVSGIIAYGAIYSDSWRLLLFSGKTNGRIVDAYETKQDAHTTTTRVRVRYTFLAGNGNVYQGSGNRVLSEGENSKNLSWLTETSLEIVYVAGDPSINDLSGHEYTVLFPLVLIPFVFVINRLSSRLVGKRT